MSPSSQERPALQMTYPCFVLRALAREGYAQARLLADTGLTEAALADPDFRAGTRSIGRFFRNAVALTGEPHLAVRLARRFEASFIGLPGYAAMNAATLREALAVLSRFFFLAFPAIEFSTPDPSAAARAGELAIRLRPRVPMDDIAYFASASALIACEGLCRAILRRPRVGLRGELSVPEPAGWAEVKDQIGFPIRFEAPGVRLFLPEALLSSPLPGADPLNHPRLVALCEEAAQRVRVAQTPLGQVAAFLQEGQNLGLPMPQVARALGYSERSLRRHLERSGTTLRKLSEGIRERRARALLANTATPIKTIAYELGFDTPSNFARSFKRWTGVSPSAFRQAHGGGRTGT